MYDTNPDDGNYSQYAAGRLTEVKYPTSATFQDAGGHNITTTLTDMFSYSPAGQVVGKRLRVKKTSNLQAGTGDLNLAYAYNNEGKLTQVTYPTDANNNTPTFSYAYDAMMRLASMTDQSNYAQPVVNGVQYNAANQIMGINYYGARETRQYNNLMQLTNIATSAPNGGINLTYNYTPGGNSGKITSSYDAISGETLVYQYDALNRLISAQGSGWAQTQSYDGFGNLTARTGYGTAQSTTINTPVNAATNQLSGNYSYDANGNLVSIGYTYDAENRIMFANAGGVQYFYDGQNKRVWQATCSSSCTPGSGWVLNSETVVLFGADGKQVATYLPQLTWTGTQLQMSFSLATARVYFGGKLVAQQVYANGVCCNSGAVVQDRLGSVGKYYPYGEERNAPQLGNDQVKFATYTRDSATGNDYADQRYYSSALGRFMTPDRLKRGVDSGTPLTWNRYAYVIGDPINSNDPTGRFYCEPVGYGEDGEPSDVTCVDDSPGDDSQEDQYAAAFGDAQKRLFKALGALEERTNVSANCQKDLGALSTAANKTIDLQAIQGALSITNFENGVDSDTPVAGLYDPIKAAAAGAAYQRQEDAKYGPGQTIGNEFRRNLQGLTADTVFLGTTIYINPLLIGTNLVGNEALLFHEALHELGLGDQDIQTALGIKVDPNNTKNISDKLRSDCITGRGNN